MKRMQKRKKKVVHSRVLGINIATIFEYVENHLIAITNLKSFTEYVQIVSHKTLSILRFLSSCASVNTSNHISLLSLPLFTRLLCAHSERCKTIFKQSQGCSSTNSYQMFAFNLYCTHIRVLLTTQIHVNGNFFLFVTIAIWF